MVQALSRSLPVLRLPAPANSPPDHRGAGFGYGLLGVVSFSVTLPATRLAVGGLDPVFVGLGRAVVAGMLAALVLLATRTRWPGGRYLPGLALVAAGVVIGFPLCTAWAWQVICWALVLSAPVLLVPTGLSIDHRVVTAPASAGAGFAYVCGVSMFLGFFAWYRGLALGGSRQSVSCNCCNRS